MVTHLNLVVTHLLFYGVDLPEVLFDLLKRFDLPLDFGDLTANLCLLVSLANLFYVSDDFGIDQIHGQIYLADLWIFLY